MHASVSDYFIEYTRTFEGCVRHMYLDVFGLVTVGYGCLIDSPSAATKLPWYVADGIGSTPSCTAVEAEWHRVKAMSPGLRADKYAQWSSYRLTDSTIKSLAYSRLAGFEQQLLRLFPDWDRWPADAQLGALSLLWAVGSLAKWPKFRAACAAWDWDRAADECVIRSERNPGVVPRNKAQVACFRNAARKLRTLTYPEVLP